MPQMDWSSTSVTFEPVKTWWGRQPVKEVVAAWNTTVFDMAHLKMRAFVRPPLDPERAKELKARRSEKYGSTGLASEVDPDDVDTLEDDAPAGAPPPLTAVAAAASGGGSGGSSGDALPVGPLEPAPEDLVTAEVSAPLSVPPPPPPALGVEKGIVASSSERAARGTPAVACQWKPQTLEDYFGSPLVRFCAHFYRVPLAHPASCSMLYSRPRLLRRPRLWNSHIHLILKSTRETCPQKCT